MNNNDIYIPAKLKLFKNKKFVKSRDNGSNNLPDSPDDAGKVSGNQFMFRLEEMEEYTSLLEELVEQRTNKLVEVVATNAKFISIVAHDLRSPFSTILGILEILKESLKDFNKIEIENYVNIASSSANKTLDLLDNLLTWTMSQNKAKSFSPVRINLHGLIKEETESFTIAARQKKIKLNYYFEPNLDVNADLQMVKTIIRNLISNAIKYSHTGGEINISAKVYTQWVEIEISDTGVGISNEAQRKLFKMDTFQSTVGTNNEKGTGLGLIICKEFVEIHGGNIWIESNTDEHWQDKGSRFKFTLPQYL